MVSTLAPRITRVTSFNFADRIYLLSLLVASALLAWRPERVPGASVLLIVNAVCFCIVLWLAGQAQRSAAWRFVHDWYPLGMFIVCFEEVSRLSLIFRDRWQDAYLLAFEEKLFAVPPTVWLAQHGSALLTEVVEVGYFSYFVLLMLVGGAFYATRRQRAFRQVMDATVFSYLLCYLFFLVFPTEGPAHTLAAQHDFPIPGGGPFHWMVHLIQKNAGVHGNAFPSVHVAGAVVSLYFAWRYVPRLGLALTPLVLLLCVGAVYDRYHYVSDVAAGALFGLVPAWIVARGWVGTRDAESGGAAISPLVASGRYTQSE